MQSASVAEKPKIMPPRIVKELQSTTAEIGQQAKFECQIEGQPQQIHWFVNGCEVTSSKKFVPVYEQGYCSLFVMDLKPEDVGEVKFVAENASGICTSTAQLEVGGLSKF